MRILLKKYENNNYYIVFYINKGFYSRISFNFNIINYVIIRKRFNVIKVQDIIDYI